MFTTPANRTTRARAKSVSKPSTTAATTSAVGVTPGSTSPIKVKPTNRVRATTTSTSAANNAAAANTKPTTTTTRSTLQRKKSTTSSVLYNPNTPGYDTSLANPFISSRPSSPLKFGGSFVTPSNSGTGANTNGNGIFNTNVNANAGTNGSGLFNANPNSEIGKNGTSEDLKRQAKAGVIRKGGVESRLEVVTRDYIPPVKDPKDLNLKRTKSNPGINRSNSSRDRFITTRDSNTDIAALSSTLHQMSLNPPSSPGHTARLAEATGVPLSNRRILGYHEQPPLPSSSSNILLGGTGGSEATLNAAREYAKPLYATRPGALNSSNGTSKARKLASQPDRVLDAEGIPDDFYLNLVSWSCLNVVGVALANVVYLWNADTGAVRNLGSCPEGTFVSSVEFSNDGAFVGIGLGNGDVELWDAESGQKLRTMGGHLGQVGALSWNNYVVSSGCEDGSIWHHDVRIGRHKVMELMGHSGAICGLKWRSDGELLASGGNDNVVNIWDGRVGEGENNNGDVGRGSAKWTKRNHTAAVKALAWCPWSPSLLATGGGTNDATIHIWNSTTGARLHSLSTPAQISSIHFAKNCKEIVTTHGFPTNSVMIHSYPGFERVGEIRDAHECRVLGSVLGPSGETLCTVAADENLKFWRLWDLAAQNAKKKKMVGGSVAGEGKTKEGILSLR